ncbi:hypothetical protein T459_32827 [Capsicum annuum]|uniref:Uncharacterized protein n=1 Tax=Capsicum annuum TaxID=4072 RepID=A0A2G2Y0N9_CAPAN|nr:hypothetical protein FXO37_00098 [Capsicum annuum]PHT63317.1 hypothetical protein T459_32827 [Capsicum annuum]
MMADQHLNARMVVEEIKIGLRVETCNGSVRGFVKCEGLEKPIREFMEGDKGKEARKKVKEIGEEAINAVKKGGGTSCQALNEVIYELSEKRQTTGLGLDHRVSRFYNQPNEFNRFNNQPIKYQDSFFLPSVNFSNNNQCLKEVLIASAKAITENNLIIVEWLMSELRTVGFVCGSPMQCLGAYMLEGLVTKLVSLGSSIYKALRCKEPISIELFSYMHLLYEICPYFKFGYLYGAVVNVMKNENSIRRSG